MRYLLTGGAGFIGCNAAARLKRRGDEVIVVDNLSRAGSVANARWLADEHGIGTTKVDLRQADAIAACVAKVRPDVVLHCAAQVAVTTSVTDPRRDFEDNALGTFNLLEAIRLGAPEAVILYTSTNKVYGGMEDVGIELHDGRYRYVDLPDGCDEQRPLDFHSPYGCSKGAADQYVRDYSRIYGLRRPWSFASHASTGTASSASRIRAGSPGSASERRSASRSRSSATADRCATCCSSTTSSTLSSPRSIASTSPRGASTTSAAARPTRCRLLDLVGAPRPAQRAAAASRVRGLAAGRSADLRVRHPQGRPRARLVPAGLMRGRSGATLSVD